MKIYIVVTDVVMTLFVPAESDNTCVILTLFMKLDLMFMKHYAPNRCL